jgi:hypothetical protein
VTRPRVTPESLAALLQDKPTVAQMWTHFRREPFKGAVPPGFDDTTMCRVFHLGACFAIFAILEVIDDQAATADDLGNYLAALEAECRRWVADMAAEFAREESTH